MYICVTHVDNNTGVPGYKAPMRNGPRFPNVKGLEVLWWDQSKWPITHPDDFPRFYGTCDDDATTNIPGVVQVLTEEEYNRDFQAEMYNRKPKFCTPRQFRLALLAENLYSQVQTNIEALEDPLKTQIKVEWEFTTEIERHSTLVENLGLTEEQLDALFVLATSIDPRYDISQNDQPE